MRLHLRLFLCRLLLLMLTLCNCDYMFIGLLWGWLLGTFIAALPLVALASVWLTVFKSAFTAFLPRRGACLAVLALSMLVRRKLVTTLHNRSHMFPLILTVLMRVSLPFASSSSSVVSFILRWFLTGASRSYLAIDGLSRLRMRSTAITTWCPKASGWVLILGTLTRISVCQKRCVLQEWSKLFALWGLWRLVCGSPHDLLTVWLRHRCYNLLADCHVLSLSLVSF